MAPEPNFYPTLIINQGGSSDRDKMKAKNGTKARTSQGEIIGNKMK